MACGKYLWLGTVAILLMLGAKAGAVERTPQIQRSIDRGVAFLKSIRTEAGWSGAGGSAGSSVGLTALVGLALLECDVPADDPAVKTAADVVRQNAPTLTYTYSLSTAIWFLDRLGQESDVALIESMTVRLLAGQLESGGWYYNCPAVGHEEVLRLTNLLNQQNVLKGSKELPNQAKGQEQKKSGKRRDISPEIKEQLRKLARPPAAQAPPGAQAGGGVPGNVEAAHLALGDNSNTQFAALALWVARRYGMPVDDALLKIERRFRTTHLQGGPQAGGWDYIPTHREVGSFPPSMTCAGLIGLAVGHGVALDGPQEGKGRRPIDPEKDNDIKAAFTNLGRSLQELSAVSIFGGNGDMRFYFIWSLERVAEVYGLQTIGKRDWYAWGSRVLLNSQDRRDGGWHGNYDRGGADTCFALLFLSRANVAKDLSVSLRGKIKDAGHALRAVDDLAALQKKGGKVAGPSEKKPDKASPDSPRLEDSKGTSAPPAAVENESEETRAARKMSSELIDAPAAQQGELLERYKQGKGAVYTLALAGAIPKLSGDTKAKARHALAERLTRMTAATLRAELKDDDPEIRRAASLACAMKDDKDHIPDLIPLLEDREALVGRAAHAALKSLSNQDFGPDKDASAEELAKAVADWKSWWQKQSGK